MRKLGYIATAICVTCLSAFLNGPRTSAGTARHSQRLTRLEAISAAHRNAQKPGSSFTVLREIAANADTRRAGDQALELARAHKTKLYENGILADVLRGGGFLLAETDSQTNNVIALHLVSLGPDGVPRDAFYPSIRLISLADAREVIKDTTEFTDALYSTPPSEASSLESRFYGGSFPEYSQSEDYSLFAIPRSLLKVGADQNESREVAVLYGGFGLSGFQYAISLPVFAANPSEAARAAADKWEALKAEFLRSNRMRPDFDFDPDNIRTKRQLQERIDVLRRLDKFVEEAPNTEANPELFKANISVATIPLQIGTSPLNGQVLYGAVIESLIAVYWQRLPTGGFAVRGISVVDAGD